MTISDLRLTKPKYTPTVIDLKRKGFRKVIDGKQVDIYTICNRHGLTIKITNYGAKVEQILAPDRDNVFADIALGFDSIDSVITGQYSMGAFIGRYANRIANARFALDGMVCLLEVNNGDNSLHGGPNGSRFKVFDARQLSPSAVEFSYAFRNKKIISPGPCRSRSFIRLTTKMNLA